MLPWEGLPLVYQAAGVQVLVKALSEGGKVRRDRSVGSTGHWNSGQGSLPWMFCYRAGAGWGGARVEGKERERSFAGILPSFLAGVVCELAGVACPSWRLG